MNSTSESVSNTTDTTWIPDYSKWRHGGWYVHNIRWPSGAIGCVSRNYPDKKWRIVCDPRGFHDTRYTFPNRDAAARAERILASLNLERTPEEHETMNRIIDRYENEFGYAGPRLELLMDLTLANNDTPLALDVLLAFRVVDFVHDVSGIQLHLDRTTGKLGGLFLPRCARSHVTPH